MTAPLRGIGVSPGVACAPAFIVRLDFPEVPDRTVAARRRSRTRCGACARRCEYVVGHLRELGQRVLQRAGPEESRIFDAQILMAQDEEFLASVETLIRNNQLSAETAYEFKALELRNLWLRRRAGCASGWPTSTPSSSACSTACMGGTGHELWSIPADEQVIVVAHELSPGLTVQLDREHVVGLVSEEGTRTSHAAILAHSLGIPAVMGAVGALAAIPHGHDGAARRPEPARSCSTRPATSWRRPRPR